MYCSKGVDNDVRYWLKPKTDFEGGSPYNYLTGQYKDAYLSLAAVKSPYMIGTCRRQKLLHGSTIEVVGLSRE